MPSGHVTWADLTVDNAEELRDFYAAVAGWTPAEEDMGGYKDYSMLAPDGEVVAGVCHARGVNAELPPQWLVYITVDDVSESLARALELGGKLLHGPRKLGGSEIAVVQDPAGAVFALFGD